MRLARMLHDISGASKGEVDAALAASDNQGSLALVMLTRDWDVERAWTALDQGMPLRAIVDGNQAGDALTGGLAVGSPDNQPGQPTDANMPL